MNDRIDSRVVDLIRDLYKEDIGAKALFDWAASRTNDVAETSIDRMATMTGISRPEAIALARQLGEIGCGEFVVGRKGARSRIRWTFSFRSLGEAAKGASTELKAVDPELAEDAADQQAPSVPTETAPETRLTIAEAKSGLAAAFGVKPEAVEIIIRA